MDFTKCTAIRIDRPGNLVHFFGWVGGISQGSELEIAPEVGEAIGLIDGVLVEAKIEYSFQKLESVELEPETS